MLDRILIALRLKKKPTLGRVPKPAEWPAPPPRKAHVPPRPMPAPAVQLRPSYRSPPTTPSPAPAPDTTMETMLLMSAVHSHTPAPPSTSGEPMFRSGGGGDYGGGGASSSWDSGSSSSDSGSSGGGSD